MYAKTDVQSARTQRTGTAFAAMTAYVYCVVGTMGVLTPEMMMQREVTSNWGLEYKRGANAPTGGQQADVIKLQPTSIQDLARIRQVLKPTVLELANLFGVSRQAVYDWQDGAQPNDQTRARLAELACAANVFTEAGVAVDTQILRRKMVGGVTLLDAVLSGGDAVQLAQSLIGTLKRESSQRERLAQQLAGRKSGPLNSSDYGAPSLAENA